MEILSLSILKMGNQFDQYQVVVWFGAQRES